MTTERLFWKDAYLTEFDARIVERTTYEDRPAVVLDRTAFYPESGGQPWDLGYVRGLRVEAVVDAGDGRILHVLERALPDAVEEVHARVDAERRADHRQQHHGQHLLSRAAEERLSARTVGFHLGESSCTVDFDREVSLEELQEAVDRANEVVWEARPVRVVDVPRAEAQAEGLDPSEHVGESIRVVEVEGFDRNACGGTHPASTAEVGMLLAFGVERLRGGSRVEFVCGRRALREIRQRFSLLSRTAGVLQSPEADAPEVAQSALARLAESDKRARGLLDWALDGEAHRLFHEAEGPPALVVRRYDGWPAADLRGLAQKLVALGPCVALLGSAADKAHVVFAQSAGMPHDIPALLRAAVELLGGRGGGRGDVAQGGGERVERLDEALAAAAAAVREKA